MKNLFLFFIFLSFVSCGKQVVNPIFREPEVNYRIETVTVSDTDSTGLLFIDTLFAVFIPNSFTPNNDGINDLFCIKGMGLSDEDFSFSIFNRNGGLIFKTNNPQECWNGSFKKMGRRKGVFNYKIICKPLFNTSVNYYYYGEIIING